MPLSTFWIYIFVIAKLLVCIAFCDHLYLKLSDFLVLLVLYIYIIYMHIYICIYIYIYIYNSWVVSCIIESACSMPARTEQSSVLRNVSQGKTTSSSFINTRSFMCLLDKYQLKTVTNGQNYNIMVSNKKSVTPGPRHTHRTKPFRKNI